MGRFAFLASEPADPPLQEGSTIPRAIRMGSRSATPRPNIPEVQATETRGARRFVPRKSKTFLTLGTGKKLDARIINMSAAAVAVEADFSAASPASVTMVGSHPVKPGRKITLGFVFLFLKPISPSQCTEDFQI